MSGWRYTEEFKIAAVKQVAERGHSASEVAARLGVSIHSLYTWTKRYGVPEAERKAVSTWPYWQGISCKFRYALAPSDVTAPDSLHYVSISLCN